MIQELNLFRESSEPDHRTSLNVLFTNWIGPFPGLHSYAQFVNHSFLSETFRAVL